MAYGLDHDVSVFLLFFFCTEVSLIKCLYKKCADEVKNHLIDLCTCSGNLYHRIRCYVQLLVLDEHTKLLSCCINFDIGLLTCLINNRLINFILSRWLHSLSIHFKMKLWQHVVLVRISLPLKVFGEWGLCLFRFTIRWPLRGACNCCVTFGLHSKRFNLRARL